MFLDEVTPEMLGFEESEWENLTRCEKWIAVGYFQRRSLTGTESALGYMRNGSFVSQKVKSLNLRERLKNITFQRA